MAKKQKTKRKAPTAYMKIAVEVMKKSIAERKNNKPSPYVGAVLVFPDGSHDTAYRGELREGDHAEYTLLDKKNRHKDLTGCWLFATLEPCAPGARNTPKISCSERIVNARISEVWFGVEDKNPLVDHGGIDYMLEQGIKVHQFDPEFHKEIEETNKEFMKWAKLKNKEAKSGKEKPHLYLEKFATETNMESLSDEALQKFITESEREYQPQSTVFIQELKEMGLLGYDKEKNAYLPTGNAILLFGKNPRNKFPQAAIKAIVHYADGKAGTETFKDALVLLPDRIEEWLKKVLPASIDRSGFRAKQIPSFPIPVIREAVINAIAHRDYSIEGAKIQLDVYPDKIIVKSPGEPVPPITIEAMKNFTATSYSRNKKLTFIFNEMGYMEESALGMDTFKSLKEKYQLPVPAIDFNEGNIVVVFPRTAEAIKEVLSKDAIKELDKDELLAFDILRKGTPLGKTEFAQNSGMAPRTAERLLKKFVDLGLIKRIGAGRSTKYVLNE